jgi:hypothetical protein
LLQKVSILAANAWRGCMIVDFTAVKIPFPGLHYTPDQDFNMKTNRGGEDFLTQNMHIMKVTL